MCSCVPAERLRISHPRHHRWGAKQIRAETPFKIMKWEFQSASGNFERQRTAWDSINQARGNHILLDSGFVSPLLKHFGDGHVTLGIDASDAGMALLVRRGAGRWETFQPSQAPIGLLLFGQSDQTGERLQEIIRDLPSYAVELSVLQQDPDYASIPLERSRRDLEKLDYIQTARLTLQGPFDEYWKQRGANRRHNLARRRRRLAEKGYTGELVARRSADEVAEAMREYGRLESTGWKAKDGTAVSENNAQGRFYREVFEHFCSRDEAIIYQFVVNEKVTASDLCLVRDGMMIVLKTAYDEAMNEYSPAFQMREDIMKQIFADGRIRVVEFYGRVMDWHTRWSREIRTLYHINCFRYRWMARLLRLLGRMR